MGLAQAKIEFDALMGQDWVESSGMATLTKSQLHYCPARFDTIVSISEIRQFDRLEGVKYFRRKESLERLLSGFLHGDKIPGISIQEREDQIDFKYDVTDGCHRFYSSLIVGFPEIPVIFGFQSQA